MNCWWYSLTLSLACVFAAGCSDDQSVDPGTTSDAGTVVIEVSYDGQSVPVSLGTIETSAYKGVELVRLSDVWDGSELGVDRSTLAFEFVASDGFTPSVKDCEDVPGDMLDKGYIDPVTRNLTWDESLGYGGCYSVRDTVEMNAHVRADDTDSDDGR